MNALVMLITLAAPTVPPSIEEATMDTTKAPGDDFYDFANGNWQKTVEIPPDRSSTGAFGKLREIARNQTATIINSATRTDADPSLRRIANFYAAWMDEAGIEARHAAPLQAGLAAIAGISNQRSLAMALGKSLRTDVDPLNLTNYYTPHLFGLWVAQGLDTPSANVPYLLQGGLGMPDRDYYLNSDANSVALRAKYTAYLTKVFALVKMSTPAVRAKRVMALEVKIARAHATRTESGEVSSPRAWLRDEMSTKAPGMNWNAFLEAANLADAPRFFAWQPEAIARLSALVASQPLAAWKDWLAAHYVGDRAAVLPKSFVDADFEMQEKALRGVPDIQERSKRAVTATNLALPDDVGRAYVAKYFPATSKKNVEGMVAAITNAFSDRIDSLTWMTPATKAKAKAKLATLKVAVGYPSAWKDYSGLTVDATDAFGNAERAELFAYRTALAKLKQPVDRDEWWMSPQTVNAVNLPLQNAIHFPAAILQPPFYHPNWDAAANFGGIGTVIGHEVSHAFDDSGALFDAQGKLENWWTPEDMQHFKAAGTRLAAQYDKYEILPGLHINGTLTLGENIADVAGLAASYDGWNTIMPDKPPAGMTYNPAQTFFIAFAQAHREKRREPSIRMLVLGDGHAPGRFRAQTVRNIDAWYTAFDVQPGQALALPPDQRVQVW